MPRRRVASLLALTAITLIVPGLVMSAPAALGGPRIAVVAPTQVRHVRPVTATGELRAGYTITHRHGGARCATGSETTGNAYRCFADFIYDPCWVTANTSFVICLERPYSHRVARLRVRKYDNTGGLGSPSRLPWGVQVGLHRATLIEGASGIVAGKRINYALKGLSVVLIGRVDKTHPIWRAREARRTNGHYRVIGWVDLRTAWVGLRSRKG